MRLFISGFVLCLSVMLEGIGTGGGRVWPRLEQRGLCRGVCSTSSTAEPDPSKVLVPAVLALQYCITCGWAEKVILQVS